MADPKVPDPLEAGMTYVEKLDFREQAHRFAMEEAQLREVEQTKRARLSRSEERQETLKYVGIALCVALVICTLIYFIYKGTRPGPYSNAPGGEERRESACIANGGGFVPKDLLTSGTDHGLCVFPGHTVEAPAK